MRVNVVVNSVISKSREHTSLFDVELEVHGTFEEQFIRDLAAGIGRDAVMAELELMDPDNDTAKNAIERVGVDKLLDEIGLSEVVDHFGDERILAILKEREG